MSVPLPELVRFESSPTIDEETIGRFKDIIGRIPPDKFERFFQVIDALVDLL